MKGNADIVLLQHSILLNYYFKSICPVHKIGPSKLSVNDALVG